MNSEKTNWKWGEEAKIKLNALSESSARANALVANQLRNQAQRMVQSKKAEFEANPLYDPNPYQSIGNDFAIVLGNFIYSKYPENKFAQNLKDNADIQIYQANIRATKEITAANEIKNMISFMKPNEILNLIKDLRENTPLPEIASKLYPLHTHMPLVKGRAIVIPEDELVQFLCPNCKGFIHAPFSEKPRTITCTFCRHKFDSHNTTFTLTNPHLQKKNNNRQRR
jgi:hypothetical protein